MSERATVLLEHHLKELKLPTFLREYVLVSVMVRAHIRKIHSFLTTDCPRLHLPVFGWAPTRSRRRRQCRSSHPSISRPVCWQARSTISPTALASSSAS